MAKGGSGGAEAPTCTRPKRAQRSRVEQPLPGVASACHVRANLIIFNHRQPGEDALDKCGRLTHDNEHLCSRLGDGRRGRWGRHYHRKERLEATNIDESFTVSTVPRKRGVKGAKGAVRGVAAFLRRNERILNDGTLGPCVEHNDMVHKVAYVAVHQQTFTLMVRTISSTPSAFRNSV